jgi:hypothetical protein
LPCNEFIFLSAGPLLDSSKIEVTLARSRSKEQLTKNVLDTLANLLSNETYLKAGRDTGMGFLIGKQTNL